MMYDATMSVRIEARMRLTMKLSNALGSVQSEIARVARGR